MNKDLAELLSDAEEVEKKEIHDINEEPEILVVDDDQIIRDSIGVILPEYKIEYAISGEEALKKLDDNKGVIIIDVRMPGMDGIQLTKELQKKSPNSIKILYTAHPADYKTKEILTSEHGLFSFVEKGDDAILKKEVKRAYDKFIELRRKRFFEYVSDPNEKNNLLDFSMQFDIDDDIKRVLEDHSIADLGEAVRYAYGCSYPENSDYILFAMEINNLFGLKGKKILDFCSGPGDLSLNLAKYQSSSVIGVDGSNYMIDFAKNKHSEKSLSFEICDLLNLGQSLETLKDADLVVCQNSMHHFKDATLKAFFKSGLDCLKPGGSMYISDYRREDIDDNYLSQRLLATNKHVRQDLVNTIQASLTQEELSEVLHQFGDTIEYSVTHPDKVFSFLKRQPEYREIVSKDPHPHYLELSGNSHHP